MSLGSEFDIHDVVSVITTLLRETEDFCLEQRFYLDQGTSESRCQKYIIIGHEKRPRRLTHCANFHVRDVSRVRFLTHI